MARLMRVVAWLALGAFCLIIAVIKWPILGLVVLIAAGRAPECSLRDAVAAAKRQLASNDAADRIRRHSWIASRDGESFVLMETPIGQFWEPSKGNGSVVLAQIAEIESKYAENAPEPVRKNDVVLDCGANVGVFTREALNRGAKLVVAIEPVPINIECIRRNLRSEIDSGRVILYPKGLWDKDEVLILHESESSSAEDSFVRSEKTRPGLLLPLTTIDKMVEELRLERVNFIKMDIEGSEPRALLGAQQTLARFRPRLEIEVSRNANQILSIARRAWPGFRSQCLTCGMDTARLILYPSLINIFP